MSSLFLSRAIAIAAPFAVAALFVAQLVRRRAASPAAGAPEPRVLTRPIAQVTVPAGALLLVIGALDRDGMPAGSGLGLGSYGGAAFAGRPGGQLALQLLGFGAVIATA